MLGIVLVLIQGLSERDAFGDVKRESFVLSIYLEVILDRKVVQNSNLVHL